MKDKEPCLLVSNGSKLKELKYLLARDAPEYAEEFNRELDKCLREKIYINIGNTDGREKTCGRIKCSKWVIILHQYTTMMIMTDFDTPAVVMNRQVLVIKKMTSRSC